MLVPARSTPAQILTWPCTKKFWMGALMCLTPEYFTNATAAWKCVHFEPERFSISMSPRRFGPFGWWISEITRSVVFCFQRRFKANLGLSAMAALLTSGGTFAMRGAMNEMKLNGKLVGAQELLNELFSD